MKDEDRLPPGLDRFGRQLEELGRADAVRARAGRRRPSLGALPGAIAAAVLAAAVAAGATAVIDTDHGPIERDPLAPDAVDPIDPSVVQSTRIADPGGGLDWALKVFTNADGDDCVIVGRLSRGRFGQVSDGGFRSYPDSTPGSCGRPAPSGLVVFEDRRVQPSRTAVFGVSAGRRPLTVEVNGERRRVLPAALGAFLVVVKGVDSRREATVSTEIDGRVVVKGVG